MKLAKGKNIYSQKYIEFDDEKTKIRREKILKRASKKLDFVYHLTRNHIQMSRNTMYSIVWYDENEEEEMKKMFEKIIWYPSRF